MHESEFEELLASIEEMKEILAGRLAPARVTTAKELEAYWELNAADVRARWGMSQRKFSQLLGISVDTLQNWEQGRRTPDGPARVLLRVAEKHPEALASVAADALEAQVAALRPTRAKSGTAKPRTGKPRAGLPK
jgi:putative transcriptional regulator